MPQHRTACEEHKLQPTRDVNSVTLTMDSGDRQGHKSQQSCPYDRRKAPTQKTLRAEMETGHHCRLCCHDTLCCYVNWQSAAC
ncbi:hypothetical protein ACOMHN_060417 [Nucella lapillus]